MPLGEKALIRHIRALSDKALTAPALIAGIGDDSAVLRPPRHHDLLITTDFSLENVHFRRAWHPAEAVGWRCLTRGLSDIAAMGGLPHAAFLSLALPKNLPQHWVNGFITGFLALAKLHAVPLAGGDTAQSPAGILADIVVVGSVPKGKAILRSGAQPGDHIYVTGELGASAFALDQLRRRKRLGIEAARHFHPQPRLEVGRWLREKNIPSAMIDISDGLSTDLHHICEESKVSALLDLTTIPRARTDPKYSDSKYIASNVASKYGNSKYAHSQNADSKYADPKYQDSNYATSNYVDLDYALHGGDDYELLFTSSRPVPARIKGIPITRIGQITPARLINGRLINGRLIKMTDQNGKVRVLKPRGWEHFTSRH